MAERSWTQRTEGRASVGWWFDVVLTGILLLAGLAGTAPAAANQHASAPPLSYVLVVAACLPVLGSRVRPLWTFVATGACTLLYLALGYAYGPILLALAVAIYGAARRLPNRRSLVAMGGLLLASYLVIGAGVLAGTRDAAEFVSLTAWLAIPAAVGIAVKARWDATVAVRSEQVRRALSEERLYIAQEVHDVAGHGFAVIAMQAGVALRVLESDAGRAREALEAIRATSREALDGLRGEIEALQRGSAPLRPGPGLAGLPELLDRLRASGLEVTADVGVDALPSDVDTAAYRVVQESLTNVLRHGGSRPTAMVAVTRVGDDVTVEVSDTGTGGPFSGPGHGIEGMRRRAEALGGSVEAGPRSEGGFAVRATLPVPVEGGEGGA